MSVVFGFTLSLFPANIGICFSILNRYEIYPVAQSVYIVRSLAAHKCRGDKLFPNAYSFVIAEVCYVLPPLKPLSVRIIDHYR